MEALRSLKGIMTVEACKYFVTNLPVDKLANAKYRFANVNHVTGEAFLTDCGPIVSQAITIERS
jgi:hypothetical protein